MAYKYKYGTKLENYLRDGTKLESNLKPPAPKINFTVLNLRNEKMDLEGQLDTGSSRTIIPNKAIKELKPYLSRGSIRVFDFEDNFIGWRDTYWVKILIAGKEFPAIEVLSSDGNTPYIGRDILNKCKLFLDGPGLSFEIK